MSLCRKPPEAPTVCTADLPPGSLLTFQQTGAKMLRLERSLGARALRGLLERENGSNLALIDVHGSFAVPSTRDEAGGATSPPLVRTRTIPELSFRDVVVASESEDAGERGAEEEDENCRLHQPRSYPMNEMLSNEEYPVSAEYSGGLVRKKTTARSPSEPGTRSGGEKEEEFSEYLYTVPPISRKGTVEEAQTPCSRWTEPGVSVVGGLVGSSVVAQQPVVRGGSGGAVVGGAAVGASTSSESRAFHLQPASSTIKTPLGGSSCLSGSSSFPSVIFPPGREEGKCEIHQERHLSAGVADGSGQQMPRSSYAYPVSATGEQAAVGTSTSPRQSQTQQQLPLGFILGGGPLSSATNRDHRFLSSDKTSEHPCAGSRMSLSHTPRSYPATVFSGEIDFFERERVTENQCSTRGTQNTLRKSRSYSSFHWGPRPLLPQESTSPRTTESTTGRALPVFPNLIKGRDERTAEATDIVAAEEGGTQQHHRGREEENTAHRRVQKPAKTTREPAFKGGCPPASVKRMLDAFNNDPLLRVKKKCNRSISASAAANPNSNLQQHDSFPLSSVFDCRKLHEKLSAGEWNKARKEMADSLQRCLTRGEEVPPRMKTRVPRTTTRNKCEDEEEKKKFTKTFSFCQGGAQPLLKEHDGDESSCRSTSRGEEVSEENEQKVQEDGEVVDVEEQQEGCSGEDEASISAELADVLALGLCDLTRYLSETLLKVDGTLPERLLKPDDQNKLVWMAQTIVRSPDDEKCSDGPPWHIDEHFYYLHGVISFLSCTTKLVDVRDEVGACDGGEVYLAEELEREMMEPGNRANLRRELKEMREKEAAERGEFVAVAGAKNAGRAADETSSPSSPELALAAEHGGGGGGPTPTREDENNNRSEMKDDHTAPEGALDDTELNDFEPAATDPGYETHFSPIRRFAIKEHTIGKPRLLTEKRFLAHPGLTANEVRKVISPRTGKDFVMYFGGEHERRGSLRRAAIHQGPEKNADFLKRGRVSFFFAVFDWASHARDEGVCAGEGEAGEG
eukprot:g16453.t1